MCGAISYVAQGSWGLRDVLGATWSGIGLSWMPLEPIGEGLGGLLGSSLELSEGSWRPLEAILGPLGVVLGPLGMVLGVMLPQFEFQQNRDHFFMSLKAQKGTNMEPKRITIFDDVVVVLIGFNLFYIGFI